MGACKQHVRGAYFCCVLHVYVVYSVNLKVRKINHAAKLIAAALLYMANKSLPAGLPRMLLCLLYIFSSVTVLKTRVAPTLSSPYIILCG